MFSRLTSAISSLIGGNKNAGVAPISPPAPEAVTTTPSDPLREMIPDYSIASYVGGVDSDQFTAVGKLMVGWFQTYGGLQPHEQVLEVGCGIGRIAIPLTQYLKEGSYVGFDIVPHGIEWCQQKVTPRYPNFRFFVADVHNDFYHPQGRSAAAEYTFPFGDGTFDFVYLTSVFTHMLPKDLERYTWEIGRVLKPGGRCFCTAYLINSDAANHLAQGTSHRNFQAHDGYWTDSPGNPEAALAYPQQYLEDVFHRSSMEITSTVIGEWWKNEFAQDILIARKLP